jgi:hypothetical protein
MQFSELQSRTLQRLDEDPTGAVVGYYTAQEVKDALNDAQLLFCFLSLCLETSALFRLETGVNFYPLLSPLPDFMLPLRVNLATTAGSAARHNDPRSNDPLFNDETAILSGSGGRLRPVRLADLDARDANWLTKRETPERYGCLGFDLCYVSPAPDVEGYQALITYARSPSVMVGDDDAPEIPENYHAALIDYAVPTLRTKEGAGELSKELDTLRRYLGACGELAGYVRTRSLALRYDKLPFEIERYDASRLLQIRKDLPPWRKEVPSWSQSPAS